MIRIRVGKRVQTDRSDKDWDITYTDISLYAFAILMAAIGIYLTFADPTATVLGATKDTIVSVYIIFAVSAGIPYAIGIHKRLDDTRTKLSALDNTLSRFRHSPVKVDEYKTIEAALVTLT